MKCLKRITPKSFLVRYSLQKGAKIVAIFMACCSFISLICFLVELSLYKKCTNCTSKVLHNIYGFSIISVLYCCCMFFVHLWFYWGAKNEKASVVLCWVVVTTLWGLQGSSLVFVLLCINITEFSISWILAVICAIIAFWTGLFSYREGMSVDHHACSRQIGDFRLPQKSSYLCVLCINWLWLLVGIKEPYDDRDNYVIKKKSSSDFLSLRR